MMKDADLVLLGLIKGLEKEFVSRGLSEAKEDLIKIRRNIVGGIIAAELSVRMEALDKEEK